MKIIGQVRVTLANHFTTVNASLIIIIITGTYNYLLFN